MAYHYKRGKYFWISFNENGRRVRRPLETPDGKSVTDEKVARYLTNEIENSLARGQSPLPNANVLASYALKDFKEYSQGIKAAKTISNTCGTLEYVINAANFGLIQNIDERRIRNYLDKRIEAQEISHVTANNIIKYLVAFMNFGVKRNYIVQNPLNGMKRYKEDQESIPRFLSVEEIKAVLTAAENEVLYPAVSLAIYTGMRLGELRRLQWADIHMENETILVKKSKSGRARGIPIVPKLKKILTQDIFPLNFTNHLRVFKRIRKKAKLLDSGWHTFRHTFASHLVMNGVPLATVAELLGHSSIKMTMQYSHLSKIHLKDSIKKLPF